MTQQRAAVLWQLYSWCVQTIIVTVESTGSSHWYCDDVRLHCSFSVARRSGSRYVAVMLYLEHTEPVHFYNIWTDCGVVVLRMSLLPKCYCFS